MPSVVRFDGFISESLVVYIDSIISELMLRQPRSFTKTQVNEFTVRRLARISRNALFTRLSGLGL